MKVPRAINAIKTMLVVLAAVSLASCGISRRLPEGSYRLKRNVVKADSQAPRGERLGAGTLGRYVQQSPGKQFLGTDLYTWLYAQADPEKEKGWSGFMRRIGVEPVVWSHEKSLITVANLENHLASRGFFAGTARFEVDTLRGKKVKVRYSVRQGEAWRIGDVRLTFRDTLLREVVLADSAATLLRRGEMFDTGVLDAERARIAANLKDRGYYDFNVGEITYIADSTGGDHRVDLEMIVRRRLVDYGEDGSPVYEPHRVYRLGEIYVHSDYDPLDEVSPGRGEVGSAGGEHSRTALRLDLATRRDTLTERGMSVIHYGAPNVRSKVLRRAIHLGRDSLWSASKVAATSADLMRLGAFRSVSVLFRPVGTTPSGEGVLDCDIMCTPGLRQSIGIEMEGSTTSSFYGLRARVGYQNRNTFRGAELFDASVSAGFEFLKSSARKLSYELGASVSLTFPRFVFRAVDRPGRARNPLTTLTLSANWQDRAYYSRALFGFNVGYGWGLSRFGNFNIRPLDINLVRMGHMDPAFRQQLNNPYLAASYDDQLIAGISASYVYNNQPRNLEAGAIVARLNVETTGNVLSGLTRAFSRPVAEGHYNIFGIQFSQYVRAEGSFSHKIVLGAGTSLVYRLQAGAIHSYGNSSSPPFDKLFFAGGANSMRGWAVRTLGPGTQMYERKDYPAQMGDVKLEVNAELRFPVLGPVNGALFADVGNIWFMRSKPDEYPDEAVFRLKSFQRQLGFDGGVGVRVDLRIVVLRLDWGIQLHSPGRPAGERWIRDFKWRNTALNFGVGYPF